MVSSVNDGGMNKNTYVRTYGEMILQSEEVRTNKNIMTTWNGNGENKKIGNTQHAVTERWVGHGQPWLFVLGVSYFQQPPIGPAGLRTLPKLGWPHLVPRWGYSNYTRGESPPSVTQVLEVMSTSMGLESHLRRHL